MKVIFFINIVKRILLMGLFCAPFILLDSSIALSQNNTVSGTITDAQTGNSLPGVNIKVMGTTTGTATNAKGHYLLTVPSLQDTLQFSFIGYETQTVPIKGRTAIDVALKPATISGNQLVVVGFGKQKQENVTGSIASVSGKDIKNLPTARFKQAIAGKMAGVRVRTVNGRPGGGAIMRIRGISSIGAGNSPLIVVDGFPRSAFSLPPDRIKSIDVLKSAAATAIYGSRGANGVILITTKEPTTKTQIQINSSVGLQKARQRGMVDMLNARQFAQYQKERIFDNVKYKANREPTNQDVPKMYRNPNQYGTGTNWYNEVLQPAFMNKENITVSGGSDNVTGLLSVGYIDQNGIVMATGYKRYDLRAKIHATLSKKLNVGLTIAPSLENRRYAGAGGTRYGVLASALILNPIDSLRQSDGSLTPMIDGPGVLAFPNPVLRIKQKYSNQRKQRGRALASAFGEYDIIKGLTIKSSFDVDYQNDRSKVFSPSTLGGYRTYPPTVAKASYETTRGINWQNKNTLHYKTNVGNHSIHALLGFTVQKATTEVGSFNAQDFPDNEIHTFNVASTITGKTNTTTWGLVSMLARVNYAYKNKYLLTASFRRDGSSRFGADNKWGTFPSISVGWRVSDEGFMKKIKKINELKLRADYGKTGNFNIGNYTHLGTVTTTNYVLNNQLVPGRSVTNLGNEGVGWEKVNQFDIGLDLRMFQNRFKFTADYYKRVTSGMLLDISTPFTSGFSSSITNRGEVTNKGIEFAIKSTVIRNSSFNWNINFNISHNANKVTKLASRILTPASTAHHITKEGYPIGQFYGYVVEGFFKNDEEIKKYPHLKGTIPGSYKYKDVNGDDKIKPIEDFAIIGNPFPDFTAGLTNSLNYKNFDLHVTMTGSYGGEELLKGRGIYWNLTGHFNLSTDVLHRWKSPENPGAGLIPRDISHVVYRYERSPYIVSTSNFWIRNIMLGYTFQARKRGFLQALGANHLRIYLSVQNAWISNTNLQNPQVSQSPNSNLTPGETTYSNYPISKIYTFGININL
jgi:TonB-linked SusC/RagA family outer membrane protein